MNMPETSVKITCQSSRGSLRCSRPGKRATMLLQVHTSPGCFSTFQMERMADKVWYMTELLGGDLAHAEFIWASLTSADFLDFFKGRLLELDTGSTATAYLHKPIRTYSKTR